jgi:hypothetical protein
MLTGNINVFWESLLSRSELPLFIVFVHSFEIDLFFNMASFSIF